jgi:hypothetical protein
MRLIHFTRRHPLPSLLVLVAIAAISVVGVRALSSQPADGPLTLAARNPVSNSSEAERDSRYTVWQPGEYVPQSEPTTVVKEAPAPLPQPEAWSQLSSLDVSLGATTEENSRNTELPAPAGMGASMNPFERDRLIAAASVETGFQGSGAIQLPSYRVRPDTCVPGRD